MNLRLFQSWHGAAAGALVLAFTAWKLAAGIPAGRAPGYDRTFLLATGWASLALFLVVLAHVLRKYVHKLGVSPEFRMRVPVRDLEEAETALFAVRRAVEGGTLSEERDVRRAAEAALKKHGVQRILRIELERPEGGGPLRVLALPTFPLGRMFRWMHAHLFYGAAAGALVLLHGGGALTAGLGGGLTLLALLVVLSGVVGALTWAKGPARMTAAERDLTAEKAHAIHENLARKVEVAYGAVEPALAERVRALEAAGADFPERARELVRASRGAPGLADLLALLGQRRRVGLELARLRRAKLFMHAWRVLHLPAAVVLLALLVLHVVSVLRY